MIQEIIIIIIIIIIITFITLQKFNFEIRKLNRIRFTFLPESKPYKLNITQQACIVNRDLNLTFNLIIVSSKSYFMGRLSMSQVMLIFF